MDKTIETIASPKERGALMPKPVKGFSKLSKIEKIHFIAENYFSHPERAKEQFKKFWHHDESVQKTLDEFSENTLTNYNIPLGVVPNVLLNGKVYCVPMTIEESSVVAASARSANFWLERGGFHAEVISTVKTGQVHFIYKNTNFNLHEFFLSQKNNLIDSVTPLTHNMRKRGGGLVDLSLLDKTDLEEGYYQLSARFETCDAMGANFINSILESVARSWKEMLPEAQIIMSILSNYTPECLVKSYVECPIEDLNDPSLEMSAEEFVLKFQKAIRISKIDVTRATTHNKGIMNGIDAVVLATGNDFRAVEACAHAFAARSGQYTGLSDVEIIDGKFRFSLTIPLAIGTVGGLTSLHPISKLSLEMLGHPSAKELMMIMATIGLAQNFAAVRSLVTSGIQKGHMKMHLMNILNHLEANELEREKAKEHFKNAVISFQSVREYIAGLRNYV